jgi:hypothetical protein
LLTATACGWNTRRDGKPLSVAISVKFENSVNQNSSAQPSSSLNATAINSDATLGTVDSATGSTAPIATPVPTGATAGSISTATGATKQVVDSATLLSLSPEERQFYAASTLPPNKLLNDPLNTFQFKRAYRWFTYKITRGNEVIKEGNVELTDPKIMSLSPVELDAFQGDALRVSMSLLQLDFIDAVHKEKFCTHGSPALVRSWAGTKDYTVNADRLISMSLTESQITTAHMAAVGIPASELRRIYTPFSSHMLLDQITGQTLKMSVCPISELQIAGTLKPYEIRHIKMMTFSSPLKSHKIGVVSALGKSFSEFQANLMDTRFGDLRAAHLLGISATVAANGAADGTVQMNRIEPADMLGSEWVLVSRDGIPEKSELALVYPKADFWVGPQSGAFAIAGSCDVGGDIVKVYQDANAYQKFIIESSESAEMKCAANGTFFARGSFGNTTDGTVANFENKRYDLVVEQVSSAGTSAAMKGTVGYDSAPPGLLPTESVTANASGVIIVIPIDEVHSGVMAMNSSQISFKGGTNCIPSYSLGEKTDVNATRIYFLTVTLIGCTDSFIPNPSLSFTEGAFVDKVGNASGPWEVPLSPISLPYTGTPSGGSTGTISGGGTGVLSPSPRESIEIFAIANGGCAEKNLQSCDRRSGESEGKE